jgi:hypothetical protein
MFPYLSERMSSQTLASQNYFVIFAFRLKKYNLLQIVHTNVCNELRLYPAGKAEEKKMRR